MALAGELFNCIKPDMLSTFPSEYERWMVIPYCQQHKQAFWTVAQKGGDVEIVTSQPCCQMRFKHDSRTPGKFKGRVYSMGKIPIFCRELACTEVNKVIPTVRAVALVSLRYWISKLGGLGLSPNLFVTL